MTQASSVNTVKDYVANKADYDGNGYDVFCECYSDDQWVEMINTFPKLPDLLAHIDTVAAVYADRQANARNSEF